MVAIHRTGAPFLPQVDAWVLAYWPHMDRVYQRTGHSVSRGDLGGWFPTRLRPDDRWAVRFRSEKWLMAPRCVPPYWTPILPPVVTADQMERGG